MSSGGTHAPDVEPPVSPPYVRPNSRFSSLWIPMRSRKGSHLVIAISNTSSFLLLQRRSGPAASTGLGAGSLFDDLAFDHIAVSGGRGLLRPGGRPTGVADPTASGLGLLLLVHGGSDALKHLHQGLAPALDQLDVLALQRLAHLLDALVRGILVVAGDLVGVLREELLH